MSSRFKMYRLTSAFLGRWSGVSMVPLGILQRTTGSHSNSSSFSTRRYDEERSPLILLALVEFSELLMLGRIPEGISSMTTPLSLKSRSLSFGLR